MSQSENFPKLPNVPIVFSDEFPSGFVNDVKGWAFSEDYLKKNIGKLLTLDIDFGKRCSLNCPHCFRRDNRVDKDCKKEMTYNDILFLVKEAKKLGLKSIKFLGKGEPLEADNFLDFLEELNRLEIIPLIFTKGHVLGDDELVKRYYNKYGIKKREDLIKVLKELNVSILLGFNSYNEEIQDKMVGVKGYTRLRNRALKLLLRARFNEGNPTRLCLATNPVTKENFNEILEIYKWARIRNIYVIVCPTMISGRAAKIWNTITPSSKELIWLYTEIYKFNIQKGIQSFEQVKKEGIASYAGGRPCNQIACGMYITLCGKVLRCPGDDVTILGNIWKTSLEDIWKNSENYGRAGTFNCGCPPKWGKSIPYNLFTDVLIALEKWWRNL